MVYWQIFAVAGILLLILEMFTPAMFFLNFALAAFVTAVFALYFHSWNILVPIFVILSALFLFALRPFLVRKKSDKSTETGMESKYIGKIVKVIEPVSEFSGVVTIYDERWEARSENKEEIPTGVEVRVIKNEGLVLYVKREV